MKALWTQPQVTYRGQIFQLEDGVMGPKPVQKPHPPVWLGGGHRPFILHDHEHAKPQPGHDLGGLRADR